MKDNTTYTDKSNTVAIGSSQITHNGWLSADTRLTRLTTYRMARTRQPLPDRVPVLCRALSDIRRRDRPTATAAIPTAATDRFRSNGSGGFGPLFFCPLRLTLVTAMRDYVIADQLRCGFNSAAYRAGKVVADQHLPAQIAPFGESVPAQPRLFIDTPPVVCRCIASVVAEPARPSARGLGMQAGCRVHRLRPQQVLQDADRNLQPKSPRTSLSGRRRSTPSR